MDKVRKVMHEFKEGELHSGSKHGPEVTSRKQAVAIAMSEAGKSKHKALTKRIVQPVKHRMINAAHNLENTRSKKTYEREY